MLQKTQDNKPKNQSIMTSGASEEAFDIKKLVGVILANWMIFVGCLIVAGLIVFMYLRYTSPIYQVNSEVLVEDDSKNGSSPMSSLLNSSTGELFQDLGGAFSMANNVDNEVEILKTRDLMYKVVKDLQLNVTYTYDGSIKETEIYNQSPFTITFVGNADSLSPFSLRWRDLGDRGFSLLEDKKKISLNGKYGDTLSYNNCRFYLTLNQPFAHNRKKGNYYMNVTSYDLATAAYQKNVQVAVPNKEVTVIDLSMTSTIPVKGETVMGYYIKTYIQSSLDQKNMIADSTLGFISKRLMIVSSDLKSIEQGIAYYKSEHKLINFDVQTSLLAGNYNDNSKQIDQLAVQHQIIEDLKQYLADDKQNKRVIPSYLVSTDPTFLGLVSKYNALMVERDRASLNMTDENPILGNIDLQIQNLRKDLINNLNVQENNVATSESQVKNSNHSLDKTIEGAPELERGYLELARQQKIEEALYMFLTQKREETAISRTSNIAGVRVIDSPKTDFIPVSPKKTKIAAIALILGLLLPAAYLYLKSLLNTRIATREDISKKTNVTILGEISHNRENRLQLSANDRSPIAEQFRSLRTNIEFTLPGPDEKIILLTSSMSGEGKSFTSLHLANTLSQIGKKVVLLEFDLRKPKIGAYLKSRKELGLSNYLVSRASLDDILTESELHENLSIIFSGVVPPNPTELLSSQRVGILFRELRERFDYVIIDSAPAGLVTDPQILGRYADLTLYIVRQGYTYKNQLHIVEDIVQHEKMKNLYIIVNDVKSSNGYGYAYGYGYGYGQNYSYGYGYGNEENNKKNWFRKVFTSKESMNGKP